GRLPAVDVDGAANPARPEAAGTTGTETGGSRVAAGARSRAVRPSLNPASRAGLASAAGEGREHGRSHQRTQDTPLHTSNLINWPARRPVVYSSRPGQSISRSPGPK